MNENEQNFESLRKLMALKRHEMPPPGYFNRFSDQVIDRIRSAGDTQSGASDASWFLRFFQLFELKPAFAGAFASALCLLLVFGIVYADRPDNSTAPFMMGSESASGSFAALNTGIMPQPVASAGIMANTNPATSLQPIGSQFDYQNPLVQQVSFSP